MVITPAAVLSATGRKEEDLNNNYTGRYERKAMKLIEGIERVIEINWINMSEQEEYSGGADRVTYMLREAGYKPDPAGVIDEKKDAYFNGTEKIRLPQEIWILQ